MTAELNRRHVLAGATVVAVGLPVLTACGDSTDPGSGPAGEPGSTLAATSDVPVGGCFVASAANVVLTQPSEGEFRGFSAICTHQGCTVSPSSDGVIPCKCHGSQFALEDGSVLQGPATSALSSVEIEVTDGSITLA